MSTDCFGLAPSMPASSSASAAAFGANMRPILPRKLSSAAAGPTASTAAASALSSAWLASEVSSSSTLSTTSGAAAAVPTRASFGLLTLELGSLDGDEVGGLGASAATPPTSSASNASNGTVNDEVAPAILRALSMRRRVAREHKV
eukprot:scaffold34315_cov101-Isochrysis_galbana.AAC.1